MGWGSGYVKVRLLLDEHGGEKERRHVDLAKELARKIREVCAEYDEIITEVDSSLEDY